MWPSPTTATHEAASFSCAALLTSAVSQAIQDVAFVAQALEAAGVVDARVVARPLKGALIDICRAAHMDTFRKNEAPSHRNATHWSNTGCVRVQRSAPLAF